ncbi:MAG TPA: 2TM domain-containing protein [Miltoncostaeaceae bacterium]|nr:2TM domain-containing protein [Miltoncostaeaceae bacterium]
MPGPIDQNVAGPDRQAAREEARRWVRRLRVLYTILGIYLVLSLMWFVIDMADGTESIWFYWPMLGTGAVVAVTAVVLLGIGGLFGADWERRRVDRYLERHDDVGGGAA